MPAPSSPAWITCCANARSPGGRADRSSTGSAHHRHEAALGRGGDPAADPAVDNGRAGRRRRAGRPVQRPHRHGAQHDDRRGGPAALRSPSRRRGRRGPGPRRAPRPGPSAPARRRRPAWRRAAGPPAAARRERGRRNPPPPTRRGTARGHPAADPAEADDADRARLTHPPAAPPRARRPRRKTRASSKWGATSWTDVGSPCSSVPLGSARAGCPLTFSGAVLAPVNARSSSCSSPAGPSSSAGATIGVVGMSSRSQSPSAASTWRRTSRRRFCALARYVER